MNVRPVPLREVGIYISEPWVDRSRRPFIQNNTAFIPVREGYSYSFSLPERKRKGRGYQVLGKVIAFHGLKPDNEVIGEVIEMHNPEGVILYCGHEGQCRIPQFEVLYGDPGEVAHKEMGLTFRFDCTRIMFSQGNLAEKRRVSCLVRPGEQVCDMFAGIGYFSLPLAKAGALVHAIEINPESVRYLEKNTEENNLRDRITITEGDCRDHLHGPYDRIHMGHYDATEFLSDALAHTQSGTVLHVHAIGDQDTRIRTILQENGLKATLSSRVVKKIGPGKVHTVTDVVIT